jgi:protein-S-isoprenylcysteine O-methyltransferase Ste14
MAAVVANLRSFVLPLTAAVIVPAALLEPDAAHLEAINPATAAIGGLLIAAGLAMLVWTVSLFIRIGQGTLAPWDPTRKLVVKGPYARVRNPMISGVLCVICGEAIALSSSRLCVWAILFFIVNHAYFVLSEEPGLVRRFGDEYEEYRRNVPRWLPRRKPWHPAT